MSNKEAQQWHALSSLEQRALIQSTLDKVRDEMRNAASSHILSAQQLMKKNYDLKHRQKPNVKIGDLVYREIKTHDARKGGKLEPKCDGPFEVHKFFPNGNVELKDAHDRAIRKQQCNPARLFFAHLRAGSAELLAIEEARQLEKRGELPRSYVHRAPKPKTLRTPETNSEEGVLPTDQDGQTQCTKKGSKQDEGVLPSACKPAKEKKKKQKSKKNACVDAGSDVEYVPPKKGKCKRKNASKATKKRKCDIISDGENSADSLPPIPAMQKDESIPSQKESQCQSQSLSQSRGEWKGLLFSSSQSGTRKKRKSPTRDPTPPPSPVDPSPFIVVKAAEIVTDSERLAVSHAAAGLQPLGSTPSHATSGQTHDNTEMFINPEPVLDGGKEAVSSSPTTTPAQTSSHVRRLFDESPRKSPRNVRNLPSKSPLKPATSPAKSTPRKSPLKSQGTEKCTPSSEGDSALQELTLLLASQNKLALKRSCTNTKHPHSIMVNRLNRLKEKGVVSKLVKRRNHSVVQT